MTFRCSLVSQVNSFFIRLDLVGKPYILIRNKRMWTRRNIVGTFADEKEYQDFLKTKKERKCNLLPPMKIVAPLEKYKTDHKEQVPDGLLKLKYKKLGNLPGNALQKMMYNMKSSSYRLNNRICLLNGTELISQAMTTECSIKNLYFDRLRKLMKLPIELVSKTHLTHIPDKFVKSFPFDSCDGLFAIVATQDAKSRQKIIDKRRADERKKKISLLPITLVCDGIETPHEIGEVLKTAEMAGCEQIYVMESCADVWHPDALVAGHAAHFKIPIVNNLSWERLRNLKTDQNLFLCHHNQKGIGLGDFISADEMKKHDKASRVIKMLEAESSVGTLPEQNEVGLTIPSILCEEVNFIKPSVIVIGNITTDAFQFAMKAYNKSHTCCVINISNDPVTASTQANSILFEARKQKDFLKQIKHGDKTT